jgi:hypothetical protein
MNIAIDNDVWCELEIEANVCKYKFLLLNIPCCYGGHKKTGDYLDNYWERNWRKVPPEVIEGGILCDSNEDAKLCATSIERLIRSGYEEQQGGWLVGMDMADVFMQFSGEPMRFLQRTFTDAFDEERLMQIQKRIKDAHLTFHFFVLPESEIYNRRLDEVDSAYEKILPDVEAELLWQLSLPNDCNRTVSVWYR